MVDKTTKSNGTSKPQKDASNGKLPGGVTGRGWKPGQSGNPNGRPRGVQSIPDILRKIGSEDGTSDGTHSKLDVVLRKVFEYALEGKSWAVEFIASRTEGKAIERVRQELTTLEFTGDNAEEYVRTYLNSSTNL